MQVLSQLSYSPIQSRDSVARGRRRSGAPNGCRDRNVALIAAGPAPILRWAGSLPITFADYGITPPTSCSALSVADHGTMEPQLMFTHA